MNVVRYVPSNPKIGDKGSITTTITMKEILSALGAVSATEVTFTAMVTQVKKMLEKGLTVGSVSVVFWAYTAVGLATTIVQNIFAEEIEPVKIKLTTKMEYMNVEYTQQGLTAYVPSWAIVDRTITLHAS